MTRQHHHHRGPELCGETTAQQRAHQCAGSLSLVVYRGGLLGVKRAAEYMLEHAHEYKNKDALILAIHAAPLDPRAILGLHPLPKYLLLVQRRMLYIVGRCHRDRLRDQAEHHLQLYSRWLKKVAA